MYFETHLFPFWERTKNVLRHTNECNIDSLMGKKKMSAVFRNSCLSQSGGIDDAKVSDRQRRCCWVQFKGRSLSFSDNDSVLFGICNQVQLSIYFSSVFPQSGFWLFREFVIDCCVTHNVMVQTASFRNCPDR